MTTQATTTHTPADALAIANRSAPFAAYPGWQLDLRHTLDSHAALVAALEKAALYVELYHQNNPSALGTRETVAEARAALAAAKGQP